MRAEQVSIAQRWRRPCSDLEYRLRRSDAVQASEKCYKFAEKSISPSDLAPGCSYTVGARPDSGKPDAVPSPSQAPRHRSDYAPQRRGKRVWSRAQADPAQCLARSPGSIIPSDSAVCAARSVHAQSRLPRCARICAHSQAHYREFGADRQHPPESWRVRPVAARSPSNLCAQSGQPPDAPAAPDRLERAGAAAGARIPEKRQEWHLSARYRQSSRSAPPHPLNSFQLQAEDGSAARADHAKSRPALRCDLPPVAANRAPFDRNCDSSGQSRLSPVQLIALASGPRRSGALRAPVAQTGDLQNTSSASRPAATIPMQSAPNRASAGP